MKLKGIQADVRDGQIREVYEEISDEEYQKRQQFIDKLAKQEQIKNLISQKMNELLKQMAIEELIKEGKIKPEDLEEIQ